MQPALVEPGPPLDAEETGRYQRHLVLPGVGPDGQRRLRNARVAVIGAGGLGSPVLAYLAAAGVGTLGVVDDDRVDASNLQRQVIHDQSGLGRAKVDSAAERIAELNPAVQVRRHRLRLNAGNALDVLRGYHLVIDGTDNFAARYLVGDACTLLGLPWIWGAVHQFSGQLSLFWGRPGDGVVYRDLFPAPPPQGAAPSCEQAGVLGALCGVIGSLMAVEAAKLICGIGEPLLGRLLVYDAAEVSWRTLRVRAAPGRPLVRDLVDLPDDSCDPAVPTLTPTELADLLAARERNQADFVLLDVREPREHAVARIPGSVLLPLGRLQAGARPPELADPTRRVVVHCAAGPRARQAIALLQAEGFGDVAELAGGLAAWVAGQQRL